MQMKLSGAVLDVRKRGVFFGSFGSYLLCYLIQCYCYFRFIILIFVLI